MNVSFRQNPEPNGNGNVVPSQDDGQLPDDETPPSSVSVGNDPRTFDSNGGKSSGNEGTDESEGGFEQQKTSGTQRLGKGQTKKELGRLKPLTFESFTKKLNSKYSWKNIEYESYANESFFYEDGQTRCLCCSVPVAFDSWAQHCHGRIVEKESAHRKNLSTLKEEGQPKKRKLKVEKLHSGDGLAQQQAQGGPLSFLSAPGGLASLSASAAGSAPLSDGCDASEQAAKRKRAWLEACAAKDDLVESKEAQLSRIEAEVDSIRSHVHASATATALAAGEGAAQAGTAHLTVAQHASSVMLEAHPKYQRLVLRAARLQKELAALEADDTMLTDELKFMSSATPSAPIASSAAAALQPASSFPFRNLQAPPGMDTGVGLADTRAMTNV